MGLGSESQQRKRVAPAPPPTPASIPPGPDNISSSATPTPDSHATETPTPASCAKVVQPATISATTVVTQTLKTTVHPPPVAAAPQTPSSPDPSSSTTDSLAVQDSSSELSHSLDDSDPDLDQTSSQCSSLTSSTVSGSVPVQTATKYSSSRMEESEKSSTMAANLNQEATSASSPRLETESALSMKLDEVETNRHSAIGTTDRPAPPKPRRSPAQDSPRLVLPPTLSSPPIELTESNSLHGSMKPEEAAPQSWLHSVPSSTTSAHKPESEAIEEETLSLGSSSSGGSSLPDHGYDASEGMGEDSGMVSSPSDTLPTSPDGSFSLDGGGCGGSGDRLPGPVRDNSSDSDEGCATWGSRHRDNAISPKAKSGGLKDSYDDDPELTAQIHQTLADFEADLADHIDIVSAKETPYTMSTNSNMVPVSVVDMDVPVTAIDEVLNDYECKTAEKGAKLMTRTESAGSKGPGFCHQSSVELRNKNNNACTAADSNAKQPSQPHQHRKPSQNTSKGDEKEERIEAKMKAMTITAANCVKKNKQRTSSAVKSNVDMQEHRSITEIKSNGVESSSRASQEEKPVLPSHSQRTAPTEREEAKHSVYQNNSSSNTLHGKVTHNVTSRFGMKTFTVIPPKPTVFSAATGVQAVTLTLGAIKIDEQGNMVKMGTSPNKVGGSSVSGTDNSEGSPVLGQTKAFWSSNERQESAVPHNKGLFDKAEENTDDMKYSPAAISENTLKTSNIEDLKKIQTSLIKPSVRARPEVVVRKEAKEAVKDLNVAVEQQVEVESRISVPKHEQSNRPALPPSILPDFRKDLSFLKPSQRTSSQYVASAINRYTSKTSAKPNSLPNAPHFSAPLNRHAMGFQRTGRSIQVNPRQSSHLLSDNKENDSAYKSDLLGPKRSMSFPEYMSDSLRDFVAVRPDGGGFGNGVGCIKGNSNTLETEKNCNKHFQSCDATPIDTGTNEDRDNIRHTWNRTPNPAQSNPLHSSAKLPTAFKTISQGQTSDTRDLTEAAPHLTPDGKPQPSVTVEGGGVSSGPPPVTVFGPVKKFRPVICRSVEKETSLHGNLMEAIQTGGGRLKPINTAGPRSMKKASYVEEENERSALLAAVRAQSNSGRLRKTKSEAAVELEKFRKASEEERSACPPSSPFPPSLTCTSPVFSPPPPLPPPAPMIAPPPPPPVMPQVKPSTVAKTSADTLTNPALAREAMLEAIRSGSAAERLKKVAVPTNTVKVNGRLGTIQATSSTLPQQ